jgi:hypothetical protein
MHQNRIASWRRLPTCVMLQLSVCRLRARCVRYRTRCVRCAFSRAHARHFDLPTLRKNHICAVGPRTFQASVPARTGGRARFMPPALRACQRAACGSARGAARIVARAAAWLARAICACCAVVRSCCTRAAESAGSRAAAAAPASADAHEEAVAEEAVTEELFAKVCRSTRGRVYKPKLALPAAARPPQRAAARALLAARSRHPLRLHAEPAAHAAAAARHRSRRRANLSRPQVLGIMHARANCAHARARPATLAAAACRLYCCR